MELPKEEQDICFAEITTDLKANISSDDLDDLCTTFVEGQLVDVAIESKAAYLEDDSCLETEQSVQTLLDQEPGMKCYTYNMYIHACTESKLIIKNFFFLIVLVHFA